jgi:hypothetical protein
LSIADNPVTLRAIIKRVPENWKERLHSLSDEFRFVVQDIVKINMNNARLIQNGLSFVQQFVEALYRAVDKELFYHPQRRRSAKPEKIIRLIDKKI